MERKNCELSDKTGGRKNNVSRLPALIGLRVLSTKSQGHINAVSWFQDTDDDAGSEKAW